MLALFEARRVMAVACAPALPRGRGTALVQRLTCHRALPRTAGRSSIARARWAALALLVLAAPPLAGQQPAPAAPMRLTLLEAVRLGRERGVSAVLARLQTGAAEERVRQRRAELLPTLGAGASYVRQTVNLTEVGIRLPGAPAVTDPFSVWRFQLRAAQTLFDASAITRLRAARDTALAAGLDAQAVGELAGATAGLAYLRALSGEETVRARLQDSVVAQQLLAQARELVEAGVSPAIDRTRSEVSAAAVRTQLEVARNARDRARLDLLRALDLPPATSLELADSLGALGPALPETINEAVATARARRAELRAERARTQVAEQALRAIRQEGLPTVGVSGGYTQSGIGLDQLRGTWNVQLGLSLSLLDGFRRPARADEAEQRLAAQRLRERDLGNAVEIEVRQALLDLASAAEQVRIAEERVRLAELELAQAQERFAAGVAGSVETTQAQGSVIAARDALIQARVTQGSARVSAYRALGVIQGL